MIQISKTFQQNKLKSQKKFFNFVSFFKKEKCSRLVVNQKIKEHWPYLHGKVNYKDVHLYKDVLYFWP